MMLKIWTGWILRYLLVTLVTILIGSLVGGLLGMVMAALSFSQTDIIIAGGILGICMSFYASYVALKWSIGKNCWGYKLVIESTEVK
jgi:hypothetical protein